MAQILPGREKKRVPKIGGWKGCFIQIHINERFRAVLRTWSLTNHFLKLLWQDSHMQIAGHSYAHSEGKKFKLKLPVVWSGKWSLPWSSWLGGCGYSILSAYLMGTGSVAARHWQVCVGITRFQMALSRLKKASYRPLNMTSPGSRVVSAHYKHSTICEGKKEEEGRWAARPGSKVPTICLLVT